MGEVGPRSAWFQMLTARRWSETPLLRRLRFLLPVVVFSAMAWAGFGQPAAALLINPTENFVTVHGVGDVGLMFDVIYSCSGFVTGDGDQSECEAATSADLNDPVEAGASIND